MADLCPLFMFTGTGRAANREQGGLGGVVRDRGVDFSIFPAPTATRSKSERISRCFRAFERGRVESGDLYAGWKRDEMSVETVLGVYGQVSEGVWFFYLCFFERRRTRQNTYQ